MGFASARNYYYNGDMLKKLLGIILLLLIIISIVIYAYVMQTYPEVKPLTATGYFAEHLIHPHTKLSKHILGFLPYWQLDAVSSIRPEDLSEVNYFGLSPDYDGTLLKETNGETEPGWNNWNKQEIKNFMTKAKIMGAKTTITISALQNDLIESILESPKNQQTLISAIVDQVKERKLDGVNIDFEYSGNVDSQYVIAFTSFSEKLKSALKKENPNAELSLSIMPLAASQNDLYAFSKLVPTYDHFIGMSYDYYGQNAQISGPTAPMYGFKQGKYFFDVSTTYEDYLEFIPKDKLLMGVPYYGWERTVRDGKMPNSKTYPAASANNYSAIISYARAREDKDLVKNQCQWDSLAEETWCWFTNKQSGLDHQAWLADDKSVQARFDFANKQNLAGIAIWTLGQDKGYSNLWNKITATF